MDVATTTPEPPLPAAPVIEAPAAESESLSDHEAQFGPGVERELASDEAPEPQERDRRGQYKSRGSRATAEDVPRIQKLTRDNSTLKAELDALKAEQKHTPAAAPAETPAPEAGTAPPRPTVQPPLQRPASQASIPQQFPTYEQFVAMDGQQDATYEDYVDARADWRYAIRRAAEKQQEAAEREQQAITERVAAHQKRLKDAKTKYPDWDQVVTTDIPLSKVVHDAVLASEHSTDIQYWLGTHRDDCAALVNESQEFSPSAVAAMRRYLDTLVAQPPARNVAAVTGSALALVPPPAPRPPNPVRTSAQAPADQPPGDEDSLAAHEKFYGRKGR